MADSVPAASNAVCVDDMGKARVMESVLADKVSSLKDQCVDFLTGNQQSRNNTSVTLQMYNHILMSRCRPLSQSSRWIHRNYGLFG